VRVITPEELKKFQPKSVETVKKDKKKSLAKIGVRRGTSASVSRPSGSLASVSRTPISPNAAGAVTISLDEYVVLDSSLPERQVGCETSVSDNCIETPLRFLAMTDKGESIDLSLVFVTTENLRFDHRQSRFVGNLFVQLRDLNEPGDAKSLGSKIRVAVNADVDDINPGALVEFAETNTFQDIALAAVSPQDPTLVRLTPERLASPQEIVFDISRPELKVSIGKEKILGFGLETTTVNVQFEGVEAIPEAAITISSESGHLEQNTIRVNDESRVATTHIRSRGTGSDRVTAELPPFEIGSDEIYYEQPWSWVIAVLMGILIGIGIRLAMRARQATPSSSIAFNIAISICGGLVTAILYGLGVNILPIPLPSGFSEGLTFLLSALGGWIFPQWLDAISQGSHAAP
jgi:hypothetical protein